MTTREMPARSTASVQGGVRPWWLHGSIVTYMVAPRPLPGALQRRHLGVVGASPGVPPLAYHGAVASHYSAHKRIRGHSVAPALGQAAGEIHERIPCQLFLSPIRTLTVGAGIRTCRPSPAQPPGLHPRGSRALRGIISPRLTAGAGIPPAPESYAGSYTIIGAFLQGSI